jgi:ascorbate-specific PTS system EIIC-type component UlaA
LKFQTKKKLAGRTYFKWSSKFNLGIPANRINWMIVLVYITATIYLVLTEPIMHSDYLLIVVFILFFIHYPRWNILVSSKGILMGLNFVSWEKMIEKKLVENKKSKHLELRWTSDFDQSKTKFKRIQIPPREYDKLNTILTGSRQG